jgi:hypothetical protein
MGPKKHKQIIEPPPPPTPPRDEQDVPLYVWYWETVFTVWTKLTDWVKLCYAMAGGWKGIVAALVGFFLAGVVLECGRALVTTV